ncbi:MAG: hypothetical protein JOZ22_26300, partial [Acidobacteriia bacterium]|nr:hypothetical protein [Terriglobia bacterium]
TLFLMAWLLTRAPGAAFLAGLFYSLTSPSQIFVPDASFSWNNFWGARRLFLMAEWDDTPHAAALALLPLAILLLVASLEKRRLRYYIPTIIVIALMAAASEFGPIEVLLTAICLLFVYRRSEWRPHLAITIAIGAFAWLLVAPYLYPSSIRATAQSAASGREPGFDLGSLTAAAVIAFGWAILWQYLPRWNKDWRVQFFVLFAYLTGSVPVLAAYLHRQLLPQPGRYKLEWEMALSLLLVFSLRPWFQRARRPLQVTLVLLFLALAAEQIASHRRYAKAILAPSDDTQSIEYRASVWAQQNLSGTRVMLPGTIGQWADAFTSVAQFGGGSWSKAMNPVQQMGVAAVYNGGATPEEDARVSLAWLRAFGVGAIAVNGPQSQEYWKPYAHPSKFEDVLPVLWRSDDVTFYRVPRRSPSLAHVVRPAAIVKHAPAGPNDLQEIQAYVGALDDADLPTAEADWLGSPNHMRIRTTAQPGQIISVQVSYHPGWHAHTSGRPIPIHADGLGLMWLDPRCQGPCELQLDYDGGWELRLAHYLSFAGMAALVAVPIGTWLRKRAHP